MLLFIYRCCKATPSPPPPHRDRYGRVLNLFMFRGKFNASIGLSLASLQPPTPPPADYVVPVVPEKPAPTPVAKKTAVVKLPGKKGGENVENFDQVEKEVDTIDLYDDDEEEEEKEKAKIEEKSEVEFGKKIILCLRNFTVRNPCRK